MTRRQANPMPCRESAALGNTVLSARAAERRAQYRALREDGATITAAAEKVGVRRRSAVLWERTVCTGLPRDPTPAEGRREDYADLRSEGMSIVEAAARLRVTRRTADRYEAWLRTRAGATR